MATIRIPKTARVCWTMTLIRTAAVVFCKAQFIQPIISILHLTRNTFAFAVISPEKHCRGWTIIEISHRCRPYIGPHWTNCTMRLCRIRWTCMPVLRYCFLVQYTLTTIHNNCSRTLHRSLHRLCRTCEGLITNTLKTDCARCKCIFGTNARLQHLFRSSASI